MRDIPDSWRPEAKARAKTLLAELQAAGVSEDRVDREMNRISESEWKKDRDDWSAWMRMMSFKTMRTPVERVAAQKRSSITTP